MANVNFYLKNPKEKENLIYAVFHFNHYEMDSKDKKKFIRLKYSSGEKILTKFWNPTAQRAKETLAFPGYSEFNSALDTLEFNIKDIYRRLCNDNVKVSPEILRIELDKIYKPAPLPKAIDLLSFIEDYIENVIYVFKSRSNVLINPSTKIKYRQVFKVLKEFADANGKEKLKFEDITPEFYNDYLNYLQKTKNFADNTCGKHIATLKKFLNTVTKKGLNVNLSFKNNEFATLSEITDTIYLTETELMKIYKLDLSNNKRLESVRDLFLIGCYTGLRYSDYEKINNESLYTNEKGTFLKINTQKTGAKVIIPMHWIVKELFNKYENILPKVITNQKMNEYLKEIGKLAEIQENVSITKTKGGIKSTLNKPKYELITTHTARRTGVTNMYLGKIPVQSIMKLTGHKTEKAFNGYLKFTPEDNANILLESDFFKPKN